MQIRKAVPEDFPTIKKIYQSAREYMRASGNPNQWGDSYPPDELILSDISLGLSYVCFEGDEILAVFYFKMGSDSIYDKIYGGEWLNNQPYAVMHRIAVAKKGSGVAGFCFSECFSLFPNLKIDTHRDNLPMQRSLERNGFKYCGIIRLEDGEERLAYQKTV